MYTIGEKIAELRKAKCITQEELAQTIGVSAQSISKWENSATMPDIMLLPVIADIFEVNIDTLFGKETANLRKTFPFDDIADESFDELLCCMQRAWLHGEQKSDIFMSFEDSAEETKKYLNENPDSQTAIFSDRKGAVYANSEIGLIFKKPKEGCQNLLEDECAISFLKALCSDAFRAIMIYQLNNNSVSYTVSSVSKKCGLSTDDTEQALDLLEKYKLVVPQNVDLDGEIIKIYSFCGGHKMLLIYTVMSLSKRIANYKEHYRGLRGALLQ
jgi:transcriptional regulator with XRE-family HTH domain